MGIGVESYAEIFTLVLGWHFYNVIWDVLAATGIVYLPFLGILLDRWQEAFVDEEGNGAAVGLRRLEVEMYLALTVVMLACVPTSLTPLNRNLVFFQPPATTANPTPLTATGAAPDSTYGTTLGGSPAVVNVPVWWYSILALSAGLNKAVITGLNLNLDDIRAVAEEGKRAAIDDPQVRMEAQRFYNECYVPTRSKYFEAAPSAAAAAAIAAYGADDPDWVGSHAFRDDANFYGAMFAEHEVPGWAFNPSRDRDLAGSPTPPQWGRPTCKEWWEDSSIGLRKKIEDQVGTTSNLQALIGVFGAGLTNEEQSDLAVKAALDKTRLQVMPSSYNPVNKPWNAPIGDALRGVVNTLGTYIVGLGTWIAMGVIRPALPFVQAIVLMGLAVFLAPIMVMSRYSLSAMLLGAIAIFTVKFWSVMWYLTDYLDDKLIVAMYPDAGGLIDALGSFFGYGDAGKAVILNLVVCTLYIGLPVVFSGMMAMIGVRVGHAVTGMAETALRPASSVANTSGQVAMGAGRMVNSIASRGGLLGRGKR